MLERLKLGEPLFKKDSSKKYPEIILSIMRNGITDLNEIITLAFTNYDFGKMNEATVRKGLRQAYRRIQEAKS